MIEAAQRIESGVLPESGALFDLSARTKLRVSGADRARYLNGQISNDLRKATETSAVHACFLTAKGKISAEVFIVADGESFLVDSDPGMSETLSARLERYIIADDVQVEDMTGQFALLHVLGETGAVAGATKQVKAERFGALGTDVWLPRAEYEIARQQLAMRLPLFDGARTEILRIALGIPRWGAELSEEIIPIEANLERSTIDYEKGCYIGQEVISRIKLSGQTNKRLCGLSAAATRPLRAGATLWSGGKEAGWVTSVSPNEHKDRQQALGFVKRGFWENGTELEARDGVSVMRVEIVPLPLVAH